jgi:general secretion pathway protein F
VPSFDYRAVSPQGEIKTGNMPAANKEEVAARLQELGFIPMSVQQDKRALSGKVKNQFKLTKRKLSRKDIADFTRQLSILVGAGLQLDRALAVILQVSSEPLLVDLIENLQNKVRGGAPLSTALLQRPDLFPDFYINLIKAAEISGNLSHSLDEISLFIEKSQALREKLVSALVYPSILVIVTLLSLAVIMIFVLPEFSQLFEDMDAPLPASTAFVLGITDFLSRYWPVILALAGGAAVYFQQRSKDQTWLYNKDQRLLTSRLTGDLVKKINMAFFSRTLGTLLTGGVPLLAALDIAKESLRNRVLKNKLEDVTASLKEGSGLAEPLIATEVFPEFALQMIQVGEETGKLDEMLIRVADIYDQEVSASTERMLSVLEPVMIIGLGLVIGGIIMSILVAILGINDLPM